MSTAPNDAAAPVNELCQSSGNIVAQHLGFTAKEAAAIALRVPDSGNDWLDAMIRTAQRNELAARAMQGFCANTAVFAPDSQHGWSLVNCVAHGLAAECESLADAMLAGAGAQIAEGE